MAAPSPPDTEAYLEKWSPQSALGQLQAKLDASEAESEVSQARPLCCCAIPHLGPGLLPVPSQVPSAGEDSRVWGLLSPLGSLGGPTALLP